MDTRSETFTNSRQANIRLKREYRKGFEVPSRV